MQVRCIMTWGTIIGVRAWREIYLGTWSGAWLAKKSRPNINAFTTSYIIWVSLFSKWEQITINFITTLPTTSRGVDTIWVIVDLLTKGSHFIVIQESSLAKKLADIYVWEVVARHDVPISVTSDRDLRFTSRFWKRFDDELGTQLHFNTSYHLQTDGQSMDYYRPLVGFSYNHNHHSNICIPPFELICGIKCMTLIFWGNVRHRVIGSTKVVLKMT